MECNYSNQGCSIKRGEESNKAKVIGSSTHKEKCSVAADVFPGRYTPSKMSELWKLLRFCKQTLRNKDRD